MKRAGKIIILIICLTNFLHSVRAQNELGYLKGVIRDHLTNDPIPFANVIVSNGDSICGGATTDFDGKYFITLPIGNYIFKVTYVGYLSYVKIDLCINSNATTIENAALQANANALSEVACVTYCISDRRNRRVGFLRGSRGNANQKYIDGIKVRSTRNLPRAVKEESPVIMGGTPAEVGDEGNKYQSPANLVFTPTVKEPSQNEYSIYVENKFQNPITEPFSTFSLDVDVASYCMARRSIVSGENPEPDAIRIEEMINYFNYGFDPPKSDEPFSVKTEYGPCVWNQDHKVVMVGIKGVELASENIPRNNLVFLIDVSGSMDSPDKLPLLQKSMHLLVDQLSEKDRIGIVVYAGRVETLLRPTGVNEKEEIHKAIDALSAAGSTAGGAGLKMAYELAKENFMQNGNNRIILATDGDFNVGISSAKGLRQLIEKKRETGIYLSVLGFGNGNYKDDKMEALADCGNGNYSYIDNILEAHKVLVKELHGTLVSVANDVKFQVEFNPTRVKGYRLIGYETRRLENEDFNDDKKDAGELGAGKTVVALYEIIPTGVKNDADLPDIDDLKYQRTVAENSEELLTLKMRYKLPGEDQSIKTAYPVSDKPLAFDQTSDDFRFVSAVSQYAMCLRNSKYKGESSFSNALELARNSRGNDEDGYRTEFVRLVSMAETLSK